MTADPDQPVGERRWIARSNNLSRPLVDYYGERLPSHLSSLGFEEFDALAHVPTLDEESKSLASLASIEDALDDAASSEADRRVGDDLTILLDHVRNRREAIELEKALLVPYESLHQRLYTDLAGLLDEQVEPRRRRRAVDRLRVLAGEGDAAVSLVDAQIARIRTGLERNLLAPSSLQLGVDRRSLDGLCEGLGAMFDRFSIPGYQPHLTRLAEQVSRWGRFLDSELLPKGRRDPRLPPEVFRARLRHLGVVEDPGWVAQRGRAAYQEIRLSMVPLAARVARRRKLDVAGFAGVLGALKHRQLGPKALLNTYRRRIEQIDELIRSRRIATLPKRPLAVRLATDLETRRWPTPHYLRPRLVGNRGEHGTFVLPRFVDTPDGRSMFDDFTYDAASWLVTAHEGRPGHDLQWGTILDRGTSIARAVFGLTSLEAEGWGLYVETVMCPHFPLEAQLVVLQARLLRAARVFLEPALQAGETTPEDVSAVLRTEIGLSPAMVAAEIARYAYYNPAQSMSYFVGYNDLLALRTEVELALGNGFEERRFHDSLLVAGGLPLPLLRRRVLEEARTRSRPPHRPAPN